MKYIHSNQKKRGSMSALKQIKTKSEINKAQDLFSLIELRKETEKREKILKDHFRILMGNEELNNVLVGNFLITLDERKTTSIDREMLKKELGEERAKEFERETVYEILSVKVA